MGIIIGTGPREHSSIYIKCRIKIRISGMDVGRSVRTAYLITMWMRFT